MIHSLSFVAGHPLAGPILERAGAFIGGEQEDSGAWNYEGRGQWRVPADLDDTSCAAAALIRLGQRPAPSLYALLWQNEAAPGGPYYTWIGINDNPEARYARQVDALVNANVLFCCGLLDLPLPATSAYLQGVIAAGNYESSSLYCPSPHLLVYCLSRAYADGRAAGLAPSMPQLREYIQGQLLASSSEPSAFELACAAVSLINLDAPAAAAPLVEQLLAGQRADGSWPAWGAYAGFAPNVDGTPALTTALALEALAKFPAD